MPEGPPSGDRKDEDLILSGAGEIGRGAVITFIGTAVGRVFNLITHAALGRALGPEDYGILITAVAFATIVARLAGLGLEPAIPRFIAINRSQGDDRDASGLALTGVQIAIASGALFATVLWLASGAVASGIFGRAEATNVYASVSWMVLPWTVTWVMMGILRGRKAIIELTVVREVILPGAVLLFVSFAVFFWGTTRSAAVGWLIGAATAGLTAVYLGLRPVFPDLAEKSGSLFSPVALLRFGFPLIGVQLLGAARSRGDRVLLGSLASTTAAGIYNVAAPLGQIVTMPLHAINRMFMPVIAEVSVKKRAEVDSLYRIAARWGMVGSGLIAGTLIVFSEPIILKIFGESFSGAHRVLEIIAVGYFVNGAAGPYGDTLIALGNPNRRLQIAVIVTASTLFGVALTAPYFGAIGASIAVSGSLVLVSGFGIYLIWTDFGIFPFDRKYLRGLSVSVVVTVSAMYFLGEPNISLIGFMIEVCMFVLLMTSCQYMIEVIGMDDIKMLRS